MLSPGTFCKYSAFFQFMLTRQDCWIGTASPCHASAQWESRVFKWHGLVWLGLAWLGLVWSGRWGIIWTCPVVTEKANSKLLGEHVFPSIFLDFPGLPGDQSWAQVEHKLSTSWVQVEYKLSTSWAQVEHKLSTSWAQVEYKKLGFKLFPVTC